MDLVVSPCPVSWWRQEAGEAARTLAIGYTTWPTDTDSSAGGDLGPHGESATSDSLQSSAKPASLSERSTTTTTTKKKKNDDDDDDDDEEEEERRR